jgi:hypothetical protein
LCVVCAVDVDARDRQQVVLIEIVGAGHGIGVRDQRNRRKRRWQARQLRRQRWRGQRMAGAVAEEHHVAGAQHDMVRSAAAHHRLMIVVGQRISVGETLEERSVAGIDVDETHRRTAPLFRGREEGRGDEGIEVAQAAAGVSARGMPDVAIGLLPHLKEAVDHVLGIGIVGQPKPRARVFRGLLKGTVGQECHVGDTSIRAAGSGKAASAGNEQNRVHRPKAWFGCLGRSNGGKWGRSSVAARRRNAVQVGRWQRDICGFAVIGRVDEILGLRQHHKLGSGAEVGPRTTVFLDNAAGQEIVDALAIARFVKAEDVIKAEQPLARAVSTYCLRISSRKQFLVKIVSIAKAPIPMAISGSVRCQK